MKPEMKAPFEKRMKELLPSPADFSRFSKIIHEEPRSFIRCNTLKISPETLIKRLNKKWKVSQPFPKHEEIMVVESDLEPGELGNAIEHILGYYYIQEISSMLPILALDPKPGEFVLDLFAAPGSKTTQIAAKMENQGTIIANELKLDRVKILSSNLERTGVSNTMITRHDAISFCSKLSNKTQFKFDKILLDVPCSGEGTLRTSARTFKMWNPKMIKNLSRMQKKFFAFAIKLLRPGGTLVYSTCTHAPEENEEVVNFALQNFPVRVEEITLPLKCRPGITEWHDKKFSPEVTKTCRIYPQDNDSEGFFVSKFTLLEEIK